MFLGKPQTVGDGGVQTIIMGLFILRVDNFIQQINSSPAHKIGAFFIVLIGQ